MAQHSNIDEVVARLHEFVESWDFSRPGKEGSLGADLAHVVVRQIQIRSVTEQHGMDPAPWPSNSPAYRDRKARDYGVFDAVNVRAGQMLSQESLYGRTTIGAKEVLLTYGTLEPPARSAAPTGYLSAGDAGITDYEKAGLAHTQGRPFYELDDDIAAAVIEAAQEALGEYIREAS